jgi:hypothetical protein
MSLLPDRISKVITSCLRNQGIDADIQSAFEEEPNESYDSRVVCMPGGASELAPHIKGVYTVTGEVAIFQSIDESDGLSKFRFICDQVRGIVGSEIGFQELIMTTDPSITIYHRSVRISEMSIDAGSRGWKGIVNWQVVCKDTPTSN